MDNNRYSRGKIYKIVDNTGISPPYVGSTCEARLCRRLQKHKSSYKGWLNKNWKQGHMRSFDVMKNNDYKIVLIEECPCETKEQLLAREQYWIDNLVCVNKNNTYHNSAEYKKKWNLENKEYKRLSYHKHKNRPEVKQRKSEHNRLYQYSLKVGHINKIDPFLFLID